MCHDRCPCILFFRGFPMIPKCIYGLMHRQQNIDFTIHSSSIYHFLPTHSPSIPCATIPILFPQEKQAGSKVSSVASIHFPQELAFPHIFYAHIYFTGILLLLLKSYLNKKCIFHIYSIIVG